MRPVLFTAPAAQVCLYAHACWLAPGWLVAVLLRFLTLQHGKFSSHTRTCMRSSCVCLGL